MQGRERRGSHSLTVLSALPEAIRPREWCHSAVRMSVRWSSSEKDEEEEEEEEEEVADGNDCDWPESVRRGLNCTFHKRSV